MKANRTPPVDLDTIMPLLIGIWRRFHKASGPGDKLQTREFRGVVECLKLLYNVPEGKKGNDKSLPLDPEFLSDRNKLSAYILYPWVIHYQEALSLIGELPTPPKRVLDVCSGPAPIAFAALRHGAREVIAVDINNEALELGAEICGRYGMPLTIRRWNCLKDHLPVDGFFDLITLGHSLEELFPSTMKNYEEKQAHFIDYLLGRLTPTGHLLLIESSQTDDNRRLLSLRNKIVAHGITIQAPCIWHGSCPALKTPNSPCYAQREMAKPFFIKEVQRALDIKLGSLKMTYLIVRSPKAAPLQVLDRTEKILPVYVGRDSPLEEEEIPRVDFEDADAPGYTGLYRVISPPIESYQGKRFYLCGTGGKKNLSSHLKEHPPESRAFEHLRRGELLEIDDALAKGQAIEIIEGTKIRVQAACGKPVPNFEFCDENY
jgi:hypothetical protein